MASSQLSADEGIKLAPPAGCLPRTVAAHPRGPNFKESIIETFADGMKHRLESTFGTVNVDVLALKDATYKRVNFCNVIRESAWAS
jgi:hypothetical protein